MKNEWNLFVLVRERIDAGEAEVSFDIIEPPMWTIFSGRPAQVRGAGGTAYELSPDFATVLHEFLRVHIASSLLYNPEEYRLFFRPGRHHPHYDPAAANSVAANLRAASAGSADAPPMSPEVLRRFLDALPPPPPATADPDANG